jgi:hypothetical protein
MGLDITAFINAKPISDEEKLYCLKLTIPEVRHVLSLLEQNKREGSYYEPKKQYDKRAARIEFGLNLILCASGNYKPTLNKEAA